MNIYLINNGLSCIEIYDKLLEYYRYKRKQGLTVSNTDKDIMKKIKREKSNRLSLNGIIETRDMRKNDNMRTLIHQNNIFYCLCDRVSIETALIFLNKQPPYCTLIILPFIKFENSIKKASDITDFKNSFGKSNNNNMKNYWNLNSNLINYNKSVNMDWTYIDNLEFSQIRNYSINSLMNDMLSYRKDTYSIIPLILFCNFKIIQNFLKSIKISKFKPNNKMKIFNTHCFKLDYKLNPPRTGLIFEEYSTYYPVKLGVNDIKYLFEGTKYDLLFKYFSRKTLTNKLNIIPHSRCIEEEKIDTLLRSLKRNVNNKNSSHQKNDKTRNVSNSHNFNNIFKQLNKKN